MHCELVSTKTVDGVVLHGSLAETQNESPLGCILCLPGVAANFYSSSLYCEMQPVFDRAGWNMLRVNTRGHDLAYTAQVNGRTVRLGAAYEIVADAVYDIEAWLQLLIDRGESNIILFGHSLGAVKSVFQAARGLPPEVSGVVAASPPRLAGSVYRKSNVRENYLESLRLAQSNVAQDRPHELIESRFPVPLLISSATYIDKYGPADRYDILKCIPKIKHPVRFVFGEIELRHGGVSFEKLPEQISARTPKKANMQIAAIEGANHMYTGRRDELANQVVEFANSVSAAARHS